MPAKTNPDYEAMLRIDSEFYASLDLFFNKLRISPDFLGCSVEEYNSVFNDMCTILKVYEHYNFEEAIRKAKNDNTEFIKVVEINDIAYEAFANYIENFGAIGPNLLKLMEENEFLKLRLYSVLEEHSIDVISFLKSPFKRNNEYFELYNTYFKHSGKTEVEKKLKGKIYDMRIRFGKFITKLSTGEISLESQSKTYLNGCFYFDNLKRKEHGLESRLRKFKEIKDKTSFMKERISDEEKLSQLGELTETLKIWRCSKCSHLLPTVLETCPGCEAPMSKQGHAPRPIKPSELNTFFAGVFNSYLATAAKCRAALQNHNALSSEIKTLAEENEKFKEEEHRLAAAEKAVALKTEALRAETDKVQQRLNEENETSAFLRAKIAETKDLVRKGQAEKQEIASRHQRYLEALRREKIEISESADGLSAEVRTTKDDLKAARRATERLEAVRERQKGVLEDQRRELARAYAERADLKAKLAATPDFDPSRELACEAEARRRGEEQRAEGERLKAEIEAAKAEIAAYSDKESGRKAALLDMEKRIGHLQSEKSSAEAELEKRKEEREAVAAFEEQLAETTRKENGRVDLNEKILQDLRERIGRFDKDYARLLRVLRSERTALEALRRSERAREADVWTDEMASKGHLAVALFVAASVVVFKTPLLVLLTRIFGFGG